MQPCDTAETGRWPRLQLAGPSCKARDTCLLSRTTCGSGDFLTTRRLRSAGKRRTLRSIKPDKHALPPLSHNFQSWLRMHDRTEWTDAQWNTHFGPTGTPAGSKLAGGSNCRIVDKNGMENNFRPLAVQCLLGPD